MRAKATAATIGRFLTELGRRARGPGRVYLTGGATAVLLGWRETTLDVDLKLDPEPAGAFEAIAALKDELGINVELAAPDDFVPVPPDWRDRSPFVARAGQVDFFHFDPRAQALAKIERGHEQDVADVRELLRRGLVDAAELRALFATLAPELRRYPALDPDGYRRRLEAILAGPPGKDADGGR